MSTIDTLKHTPLFWSYDQQTGWITDRDDCIVADMTKTFVNDYCRRDENGERIVECVNACEGIRDPTKAIPELRAALDLLTILAVQQHNGTPRPLGTLQEAIDIARTALTKVRK